MIPALKGTKRISLIDLDKQVVSIAKQRIFNHYKNIDFITSDVFDKNRYNRIRYANLIINTCDSYETYERVRNIRVKCLFCFYIK